MLNTTLWITAGLLSVVFLVGSAKLVLPKETMIRIGGQPGAWVADFRPGSLKAIGVADLCASVGLILPAAVDIAPVLVPVAAAGAALLMVGAITMRLRRGEKLTVIGDVIYLILAVFVAWGRFGPESFTT